MVAVSLSDIVSGTIMFENNLFIYLSVLEWLVILVGYKIKGITELKVSTRNEK